MKARYFEVRAYNLDGGCDLFKYESTSKCVKIINNSYYIKFDIYSFTNTSSVEEATTTTALHFIKTDYKRDYLVR